MKTLYLMRHGETLFNQLHKIQGWCDSPLSERGQRQAKVAGEYFQKKKIIFDAAFSSTQERASDTLEIVAPELNYLQLKGLKEWNFGRFEGESEALNPKTVPYGDYFVSYGGESQAEVSQRMFNCLMKLMKETVADNVLAVSHGGAIACFTRKTDNELPLAISNCAIFKFEFDGERFLLKEVINHDFSALENLQ